jgi:hypothetical protein
MIDELNVAIRDYQRKWQTLLRARADVDFFAGLKPISVGWKVADTAASDELFKQLRDLCDQTHSIYKNDRWLTTLHLKNTELEWGVSVINIMQRRPGSEDALGLDNINFYCPSYNHIDEVLAQEPELKWTHESCGPYSQWVSLWFDGTEAKLRPRSVMDVSLDEFKEMRDAVMSKIGA